MHHLLQSLELYGLIPVVVLQDASDAAGVAAALIDGGLPCAEVTFRTPAAAHAIERFATDYPQITVGAGTVLSVAQARIALNAGARFIVAPGFNRKVVDFCLGENVPVLPGVCTPSDIEAAMDSGLEAVKFFPAEAQGGVDYLKAIAAPYKKISFVPTGGIHPGNLLAYLKAPHVLACGGSWMVSSDLIAAKRFDEIRRLTGGRCPPHAGIHVAARWRERVFRAGSPRACGIDGDIASATRQGGQHIRVRGRPL